MSDTSVFHTRAFRCGLANREVRLEWNEVIISGFSPKLDERACSGAGTGACPVTDARGCNDFSKCPHLPKP
jgi:hypothetical protein